MLKRIVVFVAAAAALGALVAALAIQPSHSAAFAAGADGKAVFGTNCSSCHGATAQGAPNLAPPLTGNSFVKGDPKAVIKAVVKGMNGPIKINGKTWGSGMMPPWKGTLTNAQIAAVVTYIRSLNKASAVTEKQVAAIK